MNIEVQVKIPNLSAISDQIQDCEPLMSKIGQIRRVSFYNMIATGKAPKGDAVAPLSAKYADYKRKKVGKKEIRVFRGDTIGSYNNVASGDTLTETVSSKAAIYLQKGTSKMPKRALLPESWNDMSPKDQKAIEKASTDFVDDIVQNLVSS